jgi:hypothetical protein
MNKITQDFDRDSSGNYASAGSSNGGLWQTSNLYDSLPMWINLTDCLGLPALGVNEIAIDPNNSDIIYISTGYDYSFGGGTRYGYGIFKSLNGGQTGSATSLVYDPSNPSDVVSTNGVYIHPNNGDGIEIETKENELENVEEVKLYNRFKLYPNPTQEYLNIDYQCKSNLDDTRIVVYGLDGRVIEQFALPTHKGQITIDVSAYRNGRYIASLQWKDFRLYETKFAVAR